MKSLTKFVLLFSLCLTVGCSSAVDSDETPAASSDEAVETARLELTTDVLADTDLGGVRYTVTQVDCNTGAPVTPGYTESVDVDLADMYIPGGNGTFEDAPYDADSQHLFADQYFDLAPGCYDVLAEPIQENGDLSEDCWSAHQDGVEVFASSTTEILLIMQCRGEDNGGLDVIASANHPPQVDDLQFEPSKFTCEEQTRVCVTVSDPDSDPTEVTWEIAAGAQIVTTTQQTNADGETVACATIESSTPGTYQVTATVLDLGYNANGDLVPIEDLLVAQGDPHPSRATLKFPVHMLSEEACIDTCECPDGFQLSVNGDSCVRTDTVAATYSGSSFSVCRGDINTNYTALGAQYPNGLVETNTFWGDSYNNPNSRLNTIGVWACNASGAGGTQPIDEWIGFSSCIEAPAAGDYLVGMGADNQIRFSVDGNLVFSKTGNSVANFRYWWMTPVTLSAGSHIIELEGRNNGSDAAFGAEIYGPFPAGSLSTDANMAAADAENNIIFSTGDMLGQNFHTGENSGYICPDGYAVNMCGEKPACTQTEEVACQ
jgi:hypothetical protein